MKIKTTRNYIAGLYDNIIKIGYNAAQHLLKDHDATYYNAGVYGWNYDVYVVGPNTVIVTGYRPFGNIAPTYKLVNQYDELARAAESKDDRAFILHEFVNAAMLATPASKNTNVKKWYCRAFPSDDVGRHLNSEITFKDLYTTIKSGLDFYNTIGAGDSLVRERLFAKLAQINRVSYDTIYNMWLH